MSDNLVYLVTTQTAQIRAVEQENESLKAQLQEVKQYLKQSVTKLEAMVREIAMKNKQLEEEVKQSKMNQPPVMTHHGQPSLTTSHPSQSSLAQHDTFLTGTYKPIGAEFTMTGFDEYRRDDDVWYSTHFYTHPRGYKMCLRVDANGSNVSKGTHTSIFMHILRGEFDDQLKWPLSGNFTIQVLNQEDDKGHHTKIANCTESSAPHAGRVMKGNRSLIPLGFHSFISHTDLRPNYLKNDCLKLRVKKVVLY